MRLYRKKHLFPHDLFLFHCFCRKSILSEYRCLSPSFVLVRSSPLWLWDQKGHKLTWKSKKAQISLYLTFWCTSKCQVYIAQTLPVLLIVQDLQSIVINSHYSILRVFSRIGGQTWSNEEVIDDVWGVSKGREEAEVVTMAMTIELPSDYIRVSIS